MLFETKDKTSSWIVAVVLVFVTGATALVVWIFIGSLEENSQRMKTFKTWNANMGSKDRLVAFADGGGVPKHEELGVTAFKTSTATYYRANHDAEDGRFETALSLTKESIEQMQKEMAAGETIKDHKKVLAARYGFAGTLELKLKLYQDSVDDFTKAIEINNKVPRYFNRRSDAYAGLKQMPLSYKDRVEAQRLDGLMNRHERAMSRIMGDGLDGE